MPVEAVDGPPEHARHFGDHRPSNVDFAPDWSYRDGHSASNSRVCTRAR